MAGARTGGAELFFERLSASLHRARGDGVAGDPARHRAGGAAADGRARAGAAAVRRRAGFPDAAAAAAAAACVRAADRGRVDEPGGACDAGGRLGEGRAARGLLRPAELSGLRPSGRQHAGIVGWIREQGWPAESGASPAEFRAGSARARPLPCCRRVRWCWRWGGCIATRRSTCWSGPCRRCRACMR